MGILLTQHDMGAFITELRDNPSENGNRVLSARKIIFDNFEELYSLIQTHGYSRVQLYEHMKEYFEGMNITKNSFLVYFSAAAKAHSKMRSGKDAKTQSSNEAGQDKLPTHVVNNAPQVNGHDNENELPLEALQGFKEHRKQKLEGLAQLLSGFKA